MLQGDLLGVHVHLAHLSFDLGFRRGLRALRRSRTGRVIIALRDNQKGAQAYAVAASRAKLWAFAIAGFWAAVAGALFAFHEGVVDTQAFPPELSITLLIIVVIGGVTSLPGALLGTFVIGGLTYGPFSQGFRLLATGFGALLLLYILPGGLAQGFYGIRDNLLRRVAERRGIVVPSLLADVRTAGPKEMEVDVLAAAAATVEVAAHLVGTHDEPANVRCPSCGVTMPIADVPEHEHFQAVKA